SGSTLYMSLLSSINVLLYRYSGDTDIILGCPITGRDHIDLDNQIGFYLNTLAIRSRFSSDDSFTQLLSDVRDTTMNGYRYKGYGFDELVEDL
ncbi:condensation domain-containing protein, partial [Chryseobacterium sp. JV558]